MRPLRTIAAIYLLVSFVAAAEAAPLALSQDQIETSNELFVEVLSPFCPGRSLQDCPSPQAAVLKDEIRAMVAAGQEKGAIKETLFSRFGNAIRATPGTDSIGLLGWLAPVIFVLIGLGIVSKTLKRKP